MVIGVTKVTETWDELDDTVVNDVLAELGDLVRLNLVSVVLGVLLCWTGVFIGCFSCPCGQMVQKVSVDIAALGARESRKVSAGPPSMNPLHTKGGDWTLNDSGKTTNSEEVKRVLRETFSHGLSR